MAENGHELVSLENDYLLEVANVAEKRIEAIKKIRSVVLRLTAPSDWTDQNDKPYLAGTGCYKVARIFGIGWSFIGDPIKVREDDGHFRYDVKLSVFMKGQTIEVIGTRLSRDPFFTTRYRDGKKIELPPSEIDPGDVLKASITNAQALGITTILGIKNLTWDELEAGGIKKDDVTKIQYKKKGKESSTQQTGAISTVSLAIEKVETKSGKKKDGTSWTLYILQSGQRSFNTFDKKLADVAQKAIDEKMNVLISYSETQKGLKLETIELEPPPEEEELS